MRDGTVRNQRVIVKIEAPTPSPCVLIRHPDGSQVEFTADKESWTRDVEALIVKTFTIEEEE